MLLFVGLHRRHEMLRHGQLPLYTRDLAGNLWDKKTNRFGDKGRLCFAISDPHCRAMSVTSGDITRRIHRVSNP